MSEDPRKTVELIAERYLDELHAGRIPNRAAILAEHAEIAAVLERRLNALDRIHRVACRASSADQAAAAHLRCPHCNQVAERPTPNAAHMVCPNCGHSFGVDSGMFLAEPSEEIPESIGRFRISGLLGRGAFGAVYQAYDEELDRSVAIKVPRAGLFLSKIGLERFLREARGAARLKHPGIVAVYEIGFVGTVPYIVSEAIQGCALSELLARERFSLREGAELVRSVAEALDYAHREKVVHRDVKPGNILIDEMGRPHVSDFGLAHLEEEATVTLDGQVLGTPVYMAPEQAAGRREQVTARSDIYSLGVVLYELVTGERPFRGLKDAVIHQVLHDEPRVPRILNHHIPRDLETICLKAMAKEPSHRYESARALGEDLGRFLRGESILARPAGRVERLWRWGRRNPKTAALTGTVVILLLTVALVSAVMAMRTSRAYRDSTQRLSRLQVATGFRCLEEGDISGALPWFAEAHRLDRELPGREAMHRLRFESVLAQCPKLTHLWSLGTLARYPSFSSDGRYLLVAAGESAWLMDTMDVRTPPRRLEHRGLVRGALFGHGDRLILTTSVETIARLWEPSTATLAFELHHDSEVLHGAFSPDGELVVTTAADASVRLWDVSTGQLREPVMMHPRGAARVCFSPVGHCLVSAARDGTVKRWDWRTGTEIFPPLKHQAAVNAVVFSSDGRYLATAGDDQTAQVWDVVTGGPVGEPLLHRQRVLGASFSLDGRLLATASAHGIARSWNLQGGQWVELKRFVHILGIPDVRLSPDGRRLLTGSWDGTARLWDATGGGEVIPPLFHGDGVSGVCFGPVARRLATTCHDGTVRIYDVAGGAPSELLLKHSLAVLHAAVHPDGTRVATAGADGRVKVWETQTGVVLLDTLEHQGRVLHVSFDADGSRLVTACEDGKGRLWSATDGRLLVTLPHLGPVNTAEFSPDGARVVTASGDGSARVWDARDGTPLVTVKHDGRVNHATFSPDGGWILTASADGTARVWNTETGEPRPATFRHDNAVNHAAFSPVDGRRAVTAGVDGTARLWDTETGEELARLTHAADVNCAFFSPQGDLVVTASHDATARVWQATTGDPVTPPLSHKAVVLCAAFSPDGRMVVTASQDGDAQVWDSATGERVMPPLRHSATVVQSFFTPDSRRVISSSTDQTCRIMLLPSSRRSIADCESLARVLSSRRIDSAGGFVRLAARECLRTWQGLRATNPGDFTCSPDEVAAWERWEAEDVFRWHRASAEASVKDHVWDSLAFHADHLVDLYPRRLLHHVWRGHAYAKLGRYEEATVDFREVALRCPDQLINVGLYALLLLTTGDVEGYRVACEELVERMRTGALTGMELYCVSWTCSLAPDAVADFAPICEAARTWAADPPQGINAHRDLGVVLYRAGRFTEAIGELSRSLELADRSARVVEWVFLALCHHTLGHREQAHVWLDRIRGWVREHGSLEGALASSNDTVHWSQQLVVKVLFREIEPLLTGP